MPAIVYPILYTAYLALFVAVVMRHRFFGIENTRRPHLLFFFLLIVAAGISLTLVYTYYYTDQAKADIYRYFNDSRIISPLLLSQPVHWLKIMTGYGINDPETFKYLLPTQYFSHPGHDLVTNNTFIIRFNVLLNYFSCSNIFINTLFFNFISFAALTRLYKALQPYFASFQQVLYVPLFLLPATLFWGSGLLKEALLFTGVSLYIHALLTAEEKTLKRALTGTIGLLLLALVKLQVAAIALLCFTVFLCFRKRSNTSVFRLTAVAALLGLIYLLAAEPLANVLIGKRNEFIELAIRENAGSAFNTTLTEPTGINLLRLLPSSFVNAILRPFIWEPGKAFQKIFGLENLFFLLLLLLPLRYLKFPQGERQLLFWGFLLFALLNYLAIGITVPIMGAIVHYRVIAAPFLMLAALLCIDLERLKASLIKITNRKL